ncbi:ferritin [Kineococcus xinjiangensis]|uniref:Ferritin n=1 Tax=Kineococcus xinjiangensis TaxID=512762 RepID=A0A2S6IWY8_9ACTN|nr:ferritin [Kineococcus xinjiangensis]PPK98879.1 ferritin [Kineococcus xinjiangensis]
MSSLPASGSAPDLQPKSFQELLGEQVVAEFHASQQYVALAVWFDSHDLKQLAKHFYAQALEERNHGMMFVQFMLDRGIPVRIPGVAEVRNEFGSVRELIALALEQEGEVTRLIEGLFAAARREGDFIGEQFVHWFLKEQVEEVASMSTLLTIVDRAGDDLFRVEDWLARESVDEAEDPSAPAVAGGAA